MKVKDVKAILLGVKKVKKPTNNFEAGALVVNSNSSHGRSWSCWKNDREMSRSKSRPMDFTDAKCYYCHEKSHYQYQCKKLKNDLEEFKKIMIVKILGTQQLLQHMVMMKVVVIFLWLAKGTGRLYWKFMGFKF